MGERPGAGRGTGGVCPNVPDPALTAPQQAYFGRYLPRLAQLRRRYDPQQVFGFPHAIRWSAENDRVAVDDSDGTRSVSGAGLKRIRT